MRLLQQWQLPIVSVLCCCMTFPGVPAASQEPATPAARTISIMDVRLLPGGRLVGTVVDVNGVPRPDQRITLEESGQVVRTANSDASGQFALTGLRGGVYTVGVNDGLSPIRCWSPGTAPPHAAESVCIGSQDVVRGQIGPSCFGLTNPWVIAGVTVAAIAIPLAIAGNRDDRANASN